MVIVDKKKITIAFYISENFQLSDQTSQLGSIEVAANLADLFNKFIDLAIYENMGG